MRSIFLFIGFFTVLFLDFSFASVSPFSLLGSDVYFVPKLLFMMLLLVSIYFGRSYSIFFSIVFGVILDLYTGSIYGIHLFGFVAFVLFMHSAFRVFYRDMIGLFFVVIVNTFLFDFYIYGIYKVIGYVDLPLFDYIALRAVPSLLLNALLYIPLLIFVLVLRKIRKNVFTEHA
ncbi:rod shape-determining protein MreD [Nosocomiicoccus sp. HMSC067E10]|uniref:rod shape-determining protein MreD n=1 Tax=Nosocomiicoccus sp. HMSC067E10 TaxID=1739271 RepID=UPI0008A513AC|nr:rod shape-determining protein MreD [Nosocomiicoccus sp. HMSC067E10]OFL48153.1 rod shape-determining protein MreD [Nosocomiicoccus sp. HMSC067E10]